jgi:hypothetical protein
MTPPARGTIASATSFRRSQQPERAGRSERPQHPSDTPRRISWTIAVRRSATAVKPIGIAYRDEGAAPNIVARARSGHITTNSQSLLSTLVERDRRRRLIAVPHGDPLTTTYKIPTRQLGVRDG